MIKFYCYSRCSTCKKARTYLEDHQIPFEEYEIKGNDLSKEDIKELHAKSGKDLKKLFNTSGLVYRDLNLKEKLKHMSDDEAYGLLASDGMLVKRPILISNEHALFGFKIDEYEEIVRHVKGS